MSYSDFVFNIPSSVDFTDALAEYILQSYDIQNISNDLIILPTRRACRRFSNILSKKVCGKLSLQYAILPKIIPVGDFDDDELLQSTIYDIFDDQFSVNNDKCYNKISNIERITLLAKLIKRKSVLVNNKFENTSWGKSFKLATTLSKFIDTVNNEELELSNLQNIVPDDLECHWQDTLKFLDIINIYWDEIKQNRVDLSKYRVMMIKEFADSLQKSNRYRNIIMAGSTGSMPFTRYLMKSILNLNRDSYSNKHGYIFLPGLDNFASDSVWKYISPVHPQYNLKLLLDYLKIDRESVKNIPVKFDCNIDFEKFVSKVTAPNSVIADEWNDINSLFSDNSILNKVINLKCDNQYDEAMSIAYAIYDAKKNNLCNDALIICQDVNLIKKLTASLDRFGLSYFNGAGQRLYTVNFGKMFLLLSKMITSNFDVFFLQSFLRNSSFVNLFDDTIDNHAVTDWLEKNILRGKYFCSKTENQINVLLKKINNIPCQDNICRLAINGLNKLKEYIDCFYNLRFKKLNFIDIFKIHLNTFKSLVNLDVIDNSEIQVFNQFSREILQSNISNISDFVISIDDYQNIVETLMIGFSKRDEIKNDVDVNILSSIEARMQMADFVVISGLNEGIFPQETEADPWMSRSIRVKFGLPPLEKKIGLASHDFVQFLCSSKRIMLTHSTKIGDSEVIPSRLLFRFMSVAEKCNLFTNSYLEQKINLFVKNIDSSEKKDVYKRPDPCPPVDTRPTTLYATTIEKLIQDPYVVYASHILKLKKLHDINEKSITNIDFGSLVHESIKSFIDQKNIDTDTLYKELCIHFFEKFNHDDYEFYFCNPRFKKISDRFVNEFLNDRENIKESYSEINGELKIDKFSIRAKADRVDVLNNNKIRIVDYKTGNIPDKKNIVSGKNSQLIIESLIAQNGRFISANKICGKVEEIKYYSLKTSLDKDFIVSYKSTEYIGDKEFDAVMNNTCQGIKNMFYKYDDPNTKYIANNEDEQFKSDYEYLKRWKEWGHQ